MKLTGELRHQLGADRATLRFSEDATTVELEVVLVPAAHRGRGLGTALIERVLCLADSLGKETKVAARPIGTHGADVLERLVTYYRRFGFEETSRGVSVVYMRRPPGRARPAGLHGPTVAES